MKIAINLHTNQCVSLIEVTELDWHSLNDSLGSVIGIPVYWCARLGALPPPKGGWTTGEFDLDQPFHP